MAAAQVINDHPHTLFSGGAFAGASSTSFSVWLGNVQSRGSWQTQTNYNLLVDYLLAGDEALNVVSSGSGAVGIRLSPPPLAGETIAPLAPFLEGIQKPPGRDMGYR